MAPRPRKRKNKGLEPNLYERNGYYTYRRPDTGTWHGMGRDRGQAQDAARILNARLMTGVDHVARVMGEEGDTLGAAVKGWLAEWVEPDRKLSKWTKKAKRGRGNRLIKDAGELPLTQLTTRWCAQYLDDNHQGSAYVQYRAVLSQVCQFAQTKGWLAANPVEPTRSSNDYQKVRRRLTVEQFQVIYSHAPEWMQIAMELGLLCLFGRAEAVNARFDDVRGGRLHYIRQKTKERSKTAYVAISMTPPIEDLVRRARALPPMSPFIVHREPVLLRRSASKDHWTQLSGDQLSKEFQRLRDLVPSIARLPDKAKPSFHEIRALGSRLHELSGTEVADIQVMMGHADAEMTQVYLDGHDIRWQQAQGTALGMAELLSKPGA
ncbi:MULTISPECIES: phage integrase Arm DNA-binding domain-containing protein [unclassified Halomonas]|uniref:phage integrase Arm DNA-binding domain-containing protein n=1 Tax=unclassified Halomonas TaxID=2609666 RepID=UPI002885D39A|nr:MULTISPECIES: phage integrase Arm DNA-binding domain-containing protein [unclassified Halomonas]MDT0499669.1 phage integrase Arm DNA-binding domain-containing protein [Halomonas sp. PAR7]MDT0510514.1 phage integrase Arm DNA-binding domain-containing protein [Halomonas sp. LES1]MDT0592687.1 phage integrase Arm DNA-binding domain-containing protein [Halomonas sp. PAR8]